MLRVTLTKGFWLGEIEVTEAVRQAVMARVEIAHGITRMPATLSAKK